ncbi:hypothetical protein DPMN_012415 [Dreissena polymorpha]|uniref:Uncharacterized protein n=1 Tax=Dreissena polymorpha TaxID=45954 RepID=A0A9D4N2C6_DREPO|nr:hypothetical protein DPMN_012415 [Dreissena polymorpha]
MSPVRSLITGPVMSPVTGHVTGPVIDHRSGHRSCHRSRSPVWSLITGHVTGPVIDHRSGHVTGHRSCHRSGLVIDHRSGHRSCHRSGHRSVRPATDNTSHRSRRRTRSSSLNYSPIRRRIHRLHQGVDIGHALLRRAVLIVAALVSDHVVTHGDVILEDLGLIAADPHLDSAADPDLDIAGNEDVVNLHLPVIDRSGSVTNRSEVSSETSIECGSPWFLCPPILDKWFRSPVGIYRSGHRSFC